LILKGFLKILVIDIFVYISLSFLNFSPLKKYWASIFDYNLRKTSANIFAFISLNLFKIKKIKSG